MSSTLSNIESFSTEFSPDWAIVLSKIHAHSEQKFPELRNELLEELALKLFKLVSRRKKEIILLI